ncbi:hypothetical protein AB6O49_18650 [Streptomyces sp. SBR177]
MVELFLHQVGDGALLEGRRAVRPDGDQQIGVVRRAGHPAETRVGLLVVVPVLVEVRRQVAGRVLVALDLRSLGELQDLGDLPLDLVQVVDPLLVLHADDLDLHDEVVGVRGERAHADALHSEPVDPLLVVAALLAGEPARVVLEEGDGLLLAQLAVVPVRVDVRAETEAAGGGEQELAHRGVRAPLEGVLGGILAGLLHGLPGRVLVGRVLPGDGRGRTVGVRDGHGGVGDAAAGGTEHEHGGQDDGEQRPSAPASGPAGHLLGGRLRTGHPLAGHLGLLGDRVLAHKRSSCFSASERMSPLLIFFVS